MNTSGMTPEQFRRAALKLTGAVEGAHHDHPDFRANGRVFASLSPAGQGWAMAKVSPEEQETFVRNEPAAFEPFNGAWGKAGCTRIKLDVAHSDSARIYVSGLDASVAVKDALARTDDMGGSWEIRPIPEASGRAPYIAAVDPKAEDIVYVRLDGTPGALLVTKDGGATWQSVFSIPGYIQAFALSPDGTSVLAGGPTDGLWRAPASTLVFERISATGVQCLSWAYDSVYACGTSYAVGRSKSAGEAIEPLLRLPCIRGPLACDATTSVGSSCPGEWPALMIKIGSMYCDADAGGGGGAGGVVIDAGAGGGGGPGGGGVSSSGCGCRASGAVSDGWFGFSTLALAIAIAIAWVRRRVEPA